MIISGVINLEESEHNLFTISQRIQDCLVNQNTAQLTETSFLHFHQDVGVHAVKYHIVKVSHTQDALSMVMLGMLGMVALLATCGVLLRAFMP